MFGGVPIAEQSLSQTKLWRLGRKSANQRVGWVCKIEDAVQELFAVEVLSGSVYPEVVNEDRDLLARTYELRDEVLQNVPLICVVPKAVTPPSTRIPFDRAKIENRVAATSSAQLRQTKNHSPSGRVEPKRGEGRISDS